MYDLVRLSESFGLNPPSLSREVLAHCEILSCQQVDATSYLLAALGNIGLNLEHFPVERYLAMCEQVYAYLKK